MSPVNADQLKTTQSTVSYGVLSAAINNQMRLNIINTNYSSVFSDQLIGKATGKSRDEQIIFQDSLLLYRSYAPEFTIYNASTRLHDDLDSDGYYQTFSLVFDADIYSYDGYDSSMVYARLYLSENGGPWVNYYTTDDFIIHSDSDQDEYEIITSFASGYNTNSYDLLIDLYQVGYDGIVATYSSNDNQALYDFPLESGDYDLVYDDSVYVYQGGSFSSLLLIILFLLFAGRLLSHRFNMLNSPYKK
ncbi:choice-of-anchor H family protein [Psychromonas ingrahamii]|nr:choice-of-anchor H family protein [Psychromonas ingrahamii]